MNSNRLLGKFFDMELFYLDTERGRLSLFQLVIPALAEMILLNMVGTVNTAVLSQVSEDMVAAVGADNQLLTMFNVLISMVTTGAASVVNNFLGAKKKNDTAEASAAAIILCGFIGLIMGVVMMIFHDPVLSIMNLEGVVLEFAAIYFCVRASVLFVPALTVIFNTLMRCYGVAKISVYSGIVSNLVNLAGTLLVVNLCSGDVYLIMKAVSLVAAFSQICGLLVSVAYFRKYRFPLAVPRKFGMLVGKMLKIGGPSGISGLGYTLSQTLATSYVALLGATFVSGKVYFTTITSYCYLFSLSIGNASTVFFGRCCGAREYEKAQKLSRQLWRLNAVLNLTVSLLLLLFYRPIVGLFTAQEEILAAAVSVFVVDLVMQQSRAISHVYERALISAGDTLVTTICIILSGMINGVGLGYFLTIHMGWGLTGVWIGFAVDETVRGLVTLGRWKTGKWMQISQGIVKERRSK